MASQPDPEIPSDVPIDPAIPTPTDPMPVAPSDPVITSTPEAGTDPLYEGP